MKKEFVSTIDNAVFDNEESLINYIRSNYITEINNPENFKTKEILDKLKANFNAKFEITTDHNSENTLDITMDFGKYRLGFELGEGMGFYSPCFSDIDAAIEYFMSMINSAHNIMDSMKERYDIEEISIHSMDSGDADNEPYICYKFKLKGDANEKYVKYGYGSYNEVYIERFLDSLKQYTANKIEGSIEKITDDGYFVDYAINGIPLKGLIERGKTFRFEIAE